MVVDSITETLCSSTPLYSGGQSTTLNDLGKPDWTPKVHLAWLKPNLQ